MAHINREVKFSGNSQEFGLANYRERSHEGLNSYPTNYSYQGSGYIHPTQREAKSFDLKLSDGTPLKKSEDNWKILERLDHSSNKKMFSSTDAASISDWKKSTSLDAQKEISSSRDLKESKSVGLGMGSRLDHYMYTQSPKITKDMLFPENLISEGLGGPFSNANKFHSITPYSVRRPLRFGSPEHVRGLEQIFLKDKEAIPSRQKKRVRIKLKKKRLQGENINWNLGANAQTSNKVLNENQFYDSSKGSPDKKASVNFNTYNLDPSYRSMIAKSDYLSKYLFPAKTEDVNSKVNSSESPKIIDETKEKSLFGPWCKKDLDLRHLEEEEIQVKSQSRWKSPSKEESYIDPFIIGKVRSVNSNPRLQWHVPDTEIYHPIQAILWPGPLLKSQAVFAENHLEYQVEEQAQDEEFHAAEPFGMSNSVNYVNRKPVKTLIITEVNENF